MILSAEEMASRKFGKLRMKFPKAVSSGSHEREIWVCDCGKETLIRVSYIISGHTSSCGRCNEISAKEMKIKKFGKLRIKFPRSILPGSHKKEIWICDCGKETLTGIDSVTSGNTSSCGRCNEISSEEMASRKFGKLRMKFPRAILPNSVKKEIWVCDCGKEKSIVIESITTGMTESCGHCRDSIQDWYLKNKDLLRSFKCPIEPEDFPSGGPIPLESINRINSPFKCRCVLCSSIYFPRLSDIKQNNGGLTCGCGSYRISSGQKDVSSFIRSLGFETKLEHKVNKSCYDIFVPAKNLLIEYDGTHWHSIKGSKERDLRKEQNALDHKYVFFRITEEEWIKNRKRAENRLKSVLR